MRDTRRSVEAVGRSWKYPSPAPLAVGIRALPGHRVRQGRLSQPALQTGFVPVRHARQVVLQRRPKLCPGEVHRAWPPEPFALATMIRELHHSEPSEARVPTEHTTPLSPQPRSPQSGRQKSSPWRKPWVCDRIVSEPAKRATEVWRRFLSPASRACSPLFCYPQLALWATKLSPASRAQAARIAVLFSHLRRAPAPEEWRSFSLDLW